jgi:uncharacterized protein DUF4386
LALLFLQLNGQAMNIGLVFDGLCLLLIGYLIFRSTFLPRILGAVIALAGLGWLTFLAPPLASQILTYIEVLGFLAEAALMLWLLVVGVNPQRWQEQASASAAASHI